MALKSWLRSKFFWIIIGFAILGIIIWKVGSGYFSKAVDVYTVSKVRNYAEALIAESIEEELLKELEDADLFIENYDSNGNVSYAYVNSLKINRIRNNVVLYTDQAISKINAHTDFDKIEIPLGYFFGVRYFLADSIKIPIELEVIGNQDVELKMETISKGINTTIVEIYLDISLEIQVVIPLQNKVTVTSTKIPLAMEIMNNEVPYFLGDLFN